MKKLVMSVFAVALFASAASAYEWTVGGQLGYDYTKTELAGVETKTNAFSIAPELGKIIDEDTNVGIGLQYIYEKAEVSGVSNKTTTLGGYVFGEHAVLNPGPFKVFLRAEIGYQNEDDGSADKANIFDLGILPNIQYGLTDRLTLIVSSDVLRLGFNYGKQGDNKITNFGFNVGNGDIVAVGLKYAF
jgi:opacity protein-like surface antigen